MAKPIKIAIVKLAISRYNSFYLIHIYSFFYQLQRYNYYFNNQSKTIDYSKSTKNSCFFKINQKRLILFQ